MKEDTQEKDVSSVEDAAEEFEDSDCEILHVLKARFDPIALEAERENLQLYASNAASNTRGDLGNSQTAWDPKATKTLEEWGAGTDTAEGTAHEVSIGIVAEAKPGAYAMTPLGASNLQNSESSFSSLAEEENELSLSVDQLGLPADSHLAVATPVENNMADYPQARQAVGPERPRTHDMQRGKRFKKFSLLAFLLFVILLFIPMVAMFPRKTDTPSSGVSAGPTSQAPASFASLVLSLLPDDTVEEISQDPSSPQASAFQWLIDGTNSSSYHRFTAYRIQQRFALATLFFATGGDKFWSSNDHWLSYDHHECEWFNKPSFALKQVISKSFPGYLSNFPSDEITAPCDSNGTYRHLWLDQNNLQGTLPLELYTMLTSLQTLSTTLNTLQGTIPRAIGRMTALEGFTSAYLKNDEAGGGTIPSQIGLLTNLKVLGLNDNDHHGTLPSELWGMTNLETLTLNRNPELHATIPTEIGNSLTNLKWLALDECQLTGTIPSELGLITSLEWILLYESQLTGGLPSELGRLTNLHVLSIFGNFLDGTLPTELGSLTSSHLLSLRDNQLTGRIPSEYGQLSNLKVTFNLRSNQLSGIIPTQLGLLTSLLELELLNNRLSGGIPSEFGRLTSLGHLTLGNNSLSGTVPQELEALQSSLHTLQLEGSANLSGIIPEALCNINGSCVSSGLDACEGPHGLSFDCTPSLCGCRCSCQEAP